MGWGSFFKKFGKGAAEVGIRVGIPALETFMPASRPVVGIILDATEHHGEKFNAELFLASALPAVQKQAQFTDLQMVYVAALVQAAVAAASK